MKRILVISVILISFHFVIGFHSTKGKVFLHLDREAYSLGEQLWYQVYIQSPVNDILSDRVELEIVKENGLRMLHQSLKLDANTAFGDIDLSPDWGEGNYLIRAYTPGGQFVGELFEQWLTFFDPEAKAGSMAVAKQDSVSLLPSRLSLNVLSLTWEGGPREASNWSFQLVDQEGKGVKGRYSVSIYRDESRLEKRIALVERGNALSSEGLSRDRAPDNGLTLRGRVKNGNKEASATLAFYFPRLSKVIQGISIRDTFELSLPDIYGVHPVQVFSINPANGIVPLEIEFFDQDPASVLPPLDTYEMGGSALRSIRLSAEKRIRYRQLFDQKPDDVSGIDFGNKNEIQPDFKYEKSEFPAFKRFADFAVEMYYLRRNKKGFLQLYGQSKKGWYKKAGVIIWNGWIAAEDNGLWEFPWRDIEEVGLFTTQSSSFSALGPLGAFGALDISTRNAQIPEKVKDAFLFSEVNGWHPPRIFQIPSGLDSRSPDLRACEWWQRGETAENGEIKVNYISSDDPESLILEIWYIDERGQMGTFRRPLSIGN